jgi:hypothetical protein
MLLANLHKGRKIKTMTNKNNNRNQPHTGGSKADTEFGAEQGQSKKARKQAARENKKNS